MPQRALIAVDLLTQYLGSVNALYQPPALPYPAEDPASPLSPGTHTIVVQHGPSHVEQRYHVAGAGPVCIAHSGGPGIGWEYLRMPMLERSLTMVYIEPVARAHPVDSPPPTTTPSPRTPTFCTP